MKRISFEEQEEGSQPNEWLDERLPAVEIAFVYEKNRRSASKERTQLGTKKKTAIQIRLTFIFLLKFLEADFFPPRKKAICGPDR